MKKNLLILTALFLICATGAARAADSAPLYQNFVSYFAGIELLSTDKTLSRTQAAQRYHRLCVLTGIDGAKAKVFVNGYRNDPAGWQKLRAAVLDALQKRG
ncbi:MAG TPA: hypothetical protein VKF42_02405 [Chitinivibrionales bacterium]|jgi:hypothetical protein|nr:hypothetical protein [Chitinivibrionales bacterium]